MKNNNNTLVLAAVIIAIAALGLVTVIAVDIILTSQEADAIGCINPNAPGGGSIAVNASKGRCVH